MLPPARMQGDDRCDGLGWDNPIDAVGIEATVVDHRAHRDWEGVRRAGLQETIQTRGAHGTVSDMTRGEADVHWEGMLWGDDTGLQRAVAKNVRVTRGVIAPGSRGIGVPPVVLTARDALGTTVTGGTAVRTSPSWQCRAVAAEDEGLAIPQEPALHGGEHPAGAQQVFKAREECLGTGLVSGRQQLLGEAFGHGVRLRGITGLSGMPLGLLLLEVTPMAPLAQAAGADAMGTRRRRGAIFETVDEGIQGPNRRCLERREARELRKARMGAQVVGPLGETFVVEEQHAEEGPEHTDGVVRRPAAGAGGVERPQKRASGVQIEAQQYEGGLVPGLGQAAGLAAQPTLELGGEGRALLGMRWGHSRFLLGQKGKPMGDDGSIVPRSVEAGKVSRFFAFCP